MQQFGDTVNVINRTKSSVLWAMWDGRQYHFDPGETPNVPVEIAQAAYRQNPLHGSEDPLGDPELHDSLIGIVGAKAPYGNITPIEQSDAGERLDRRKVHGLGRKVQRLDAGGPSYFDATRGTEKIDLTDDAVTRK